MIFRGGRLLILCLVGIVPANTAAADKELLISADTRLRYDTISQNDLPDPATAVTLSGRIAAEWQPNATFTALVEVEGVGAISDDFVDAPWIPLDKPFIPDPDHIDLNRAQIQARLHDEAFVTLGRQTFFLDDQRFLGMAGFRQNRRSFDAIRLSWRDAHSNTYQIGYIDKVHRPLGNRTPFGEFDSNSWFANANLETPIGRIGVFHYALDLETGPDTNRIKGLSSATTGIRFDGRYHQTHLKLDVEASYAEQRDYADNPQSYSAAYWMLGVTGYAHNFEVNVRSEIMGADTKQAFQTPLAGLHKFHGEADVFLSTPADGLVDVSVGLTYNGGRIGPFADITPSLRIHRFEADRGGAFYGSEIDLGISAKMSDFTVRLVVADYRADKFAADRQRAILAISKRF